MKHASRAISKGWRFLDPSSLIFGL